MTTTPSEPKALQQAFFSSLKATYGEALARYKAEVPQADRDALRDQWESDLRERGLPSLALANLVALSTLLPYLELSQELTMEELQQALVGQILVLVDDVVNPNS